MKIANIEFPEIPIILAPMEDVTELPFRLICKRYGADLLFTEFVASEGLIRDVSKSVDKLRIDERERPVGIQIFGHDVNSLVLAAEKALDANPDIIDLNCGCPVKKVVNKGAGSAMMKTPEKMEEAVRRIVQISNKPVTVKTRVGWDANSINVEEIVLRLQDAGVAAVTIHGRTRSQMYTGEADWSIIARVKANPNISIPIIGNGDIVSGESAKQKLALSNVDGLMVGRAAIGNPWIFNQIKHYLKTGEELPQPNMNERIDVCKEHIEMSLDYKGDKRTIFEMRHHYVKYFKGVENFKPFKMRLMQATNIEEVYDVLEELRDD
ncbi:tRNA dihydrouridine synthase DusB [Bacteroidales bacterium OttesenSCG-928-K03]|nr:tRNA dihydrouridine synthase DusB [Bacteroidales bacterium OttesenSCG-928-L14]MDL2242111.1 tRNA dihydrouridine synthase DusB [Bacteroidales bacterium OttesenSCG-928-K03]